MMPRASQSIDQYLHECEVLSGKFLPRAHPQQIAELERLGYYLQSEFHEIDNEFGIPAFHTYGWCLRGSDEFQDVEESYSEADAWALALAQHEGRVMSSQLFDPFSPSHGWCRGHQHAFIRVCSYCVIDHRLVERKARLQAAEKVLNRMFRSIDFKYDDRPRPRLRAKFEAQILTLVGADGPCYLTEPGLWGHFSDWYKDVNGVRPRDERSAADVRAWCNRQLLEEQAA